MEVNPLSIILVKSDSKGDRLLFRYPYNLPQQFQAAVIPSRKTPYSLINAGEDILQNAPPSNICFDQLYGISDKDLATLFAVKSELCNQKFELKVNDVRFVSHPTLLRSDQGSSEQKTSSYIQINVVFALHAQASYSVVNSYYELSKRIGFALIYEERRDGYISREIKTMVAVMDENSALQEQEQQPAGTTGTGVTGGPSGGPGSTGASGQTVVTNAAATAAGIAVSVFDTILKNTTLAQFIKTIYHDLCSTGLLNVTMNQTVTLSFCLPQKAHQFHKKGVVVEPETIDRCVDSLKPYHGMLLLVDPSELFDCVPPSAANMLLQLIEVYNPLKSLQNMASDAELLIEYVNQIVGHLVYWAKATIIYPLCETNVYVIAPDAQLNIHSNLPDKFATKFPGMSLFEVISDFSLPTSIGHLTTPLQHPARQGRLAQMVLWMLQHHLLMQLHTYVQFVANLDGIETEEEMEGAAGLAGAGSGGGLATESSRANANQQHTLYGSSAPSGSSSQPLAVPMGGNRKHSLSEDRYSDSLSALLTTSVVSVASNTRPSSVSHRSNMSHSSVGGLQTASSTENDESIASIDEDDKLRRLLAAFPEPDRKAVARIPAAKNPEDLALMVRLWQKGYFMGEHHLEEIMYFENLRRSQLLQLVDKFREVLIIYETEDPVIANLYSEQTDD
ncbi:GATOR complex protein NPRL3 [Anopheles ziemanni]|uniref:GATOR complex protein NPRL3 n=1 Tax=Anopheles coustani TaxID=139045 RepID=UPI00265ABE71|nr:GATOR complex protein NPRL3 [Anopheles coustani]XP_058173774.1 GATOR complex protein NPRL3 [Anopheles ziemanni]